MKVPVIASGSLTVTSLFMIAMSVGCPLSAAQPDDYSVLAINPNEVTDSTAYSAAQPPIQNPNGQPGIATVYTHRDGTRQIADTILVLPDASAAAGALQEARAALGNTVTGGTPQPAAVGTCGTMVSGSSPDGSKSVSVLLFTQGNAFATVEFDGPANDPVPPDMVIEIGQAQDTAIKNGLAI